MGTLQIQTSADDAQVRSGIVATLTAQEAKVVTNEPGTLVLETGSVGKAFLAGPFRSTAKMPMRIQVTTAPSDGGTSVTIDVGSHGTGGGFASGGLIGLSKQRKAEQHWMQQVVSAIPGQTPGSPL